MTETTEDYLAHFGIKKSINGQQIEPLTEEFLAHHGVKGMHWGQKKARAVEAVKGAPAAAKARYQGLSKESQHTAKKAGATAGIALVAGSVIGGPLVGVGAAVVTGLLTKNGKKLVKDLKR